MTIQLEQLMKLISIAMEVIAESDVLGSTHKAISLSVLQSMQAIAANDLCDSDLLEFQQDVLGQWNETVGPDVEKFWERVREAGIELNRFDVVREVLKAGKVSDPFHYSQLEDYFEWLQYSDKITLDEAERLNEILDAFADAPENQHYFDSEDEEPTDDISAVAEDTASIDVSVGAIARISADKYAFDYWGTERYEKLTEMGYQGGGPSWSGIIFGLLSLKHPEYVAQVRLDDESDCVRALSSSLEALKTIAELVASAIASDEVLTQAIEIAESLGAME